MSGEKNIVKIEAQQAHQSGYSAHFILANLLCTY